MLLLSKVKATLCNHYYPAGAGAGADIDEVTMFADYFFLVLIF